ncbi:F-box/LRR-repeat protein 15-like [Liolophura sinensis]|uniref:F-box/LRR-repeat protein 15-like n=1 Tax=Liolophura sinensis TaxID=3198878 RepID=UPI0031580D31
MTDPESKLVLSSSGDGQNSTVVSPWELPWQDVWFELILSRLSLKELFLLKAVSQESKELVKEYFKYRFVVDLSSVGAKFNKGAFLALTEDMQNLRELVLKNTKDWLTDDVLMPVLGSNVHLRRVDLTGCNNISNLVLQVLASHCPELRELCLCSCHWVSQEGLTSVAMQCRKLEKLNLTGCWDIGDDTVIALVLFCQNLMSLHLGNIYGLTDEAVCTIARTCRHLQQLSLKGCWRVTDQAVRILAEYCPTLQGLQVRECRNITEISLSAMRKRKVRLDVPPKFDNKRKALVKLHLQI